ncbi:MAG: toast rack family protein, partial [Chloroflexota bacterium]|nr:toast rack family protein [Chloroflexota bacterium]
MQRSETVPAGGATSARVEIGMAVGELRISGGATELMDADFTYDDELEPEVEYRVDGGQGVLTVKQGSKKNVRSTQNEWNIRLNDR